MYEVNGRSLSESEYKELCKLVDAESKGEDVKALASESLHPNGDDMSPNRESVATYCALRRAGLVSGMPCDNDFVFIELSHAGRDFVRDYRSKAAAEDKSRKSQWRHDVRVAAFGSITGGVLGLVGGCFSSQFVEWLSGLF